VFRGDAAAGRCYTFVMRFLPAIALAALFSACTARLESGTSPAIDSGQAVSIAMPVSRSGADRVGAQLPSSIELSTADSSPVPRATLLRWWTDTCPFCVASLPALEQLRVTYADRGLQTIAVYHPKPPRALDSVDIEMVRADALERGYSGRLLMDAEWSSLKELWLSTGKRSATSASFLCDANGVVRFVHPGPEFHRSDDSAHALCDEDFRALEQAVQFLLTD
jgi:hypothetical protein